MRPINWFKTLEPDIPFSFSNTIINHTTIQFRLTGAFLQLKKTKECSLKHAATLQLRISNSITNRTRRFALGHFIESKHTNLRLDHSFDVSQLSQIEFFMKKYGKFCKKCCTVELFGEVLLPENFSDFKILQDNASREFRHRKPKFEPENDEIMKTFYRDGVKIENHIVGHGRRAQRGDKVHVFFKGKLDPSKNKTIDRSTFKNPSVFKLGSKKIIKGMSIAVLGMCVGGNREVVIPPNLAFGKRGLAPTVPSNATLYYDIHLKELDSRTKVRKQEVNKQREKQLRTRERRQRYMTKGEKELLKRKKKRRR